MVFLLTISSKRSEISLSSAFKTDKSVGNIAVRASLKEVCVKGTLKEGSTSGSCQKAPQTCDTTSTPAFTTSRGLSGKTVK